MIMNELFDLFERECLPEVTPRVARDYRNMVDNFLRPFFGHMNVQDVKPRHVADFINVRKGRVHRNRMVMILSSIYKRAMGSWCIEMDLVNPCIPVRRHSTKPRERYITDEEFAAFRATCPWAIQIAMDLALLIGQRQSDIVQMRWDQIHDGEIWINQGKTGVKLAIGISPAVEAVLDRAWLLQPVFPHVYVIKTKFGRNYTPDGFRALWQVYMRKWMRAGNENFHFHDIRAKSISDNRNLQAASELAGHIDQKMTKRVYDRNRRKVMPLR